MKINAILVLLAAGCGGILATAGCAAKAARATPVAVAPVPHASAPSEEAEEPISVPQTTAILPRPQVIPAEALVVAPPELPTAPPEPPAQPPKPRPAPRTDSRPAQTQPAGPQPPPTRRRIRPVESAAEQRRLQTVIADRQHQAQEILAKARARSLSDSEKNTVERIQAFLEQTDGALKEQDLELAEALSSRALLLSRELAPEK